MNDPVAKSIVVLGGCLLAGLIALGWQVGHATLRVKSLERTVAVKGLSGHEVPADIAIWPLTFQEASGDLNGIFESIQRKNALITKFLAGHGITPEEITVAPPTVTDLHAQSYGDKSNILFRYTGSSTVTVYSANVAAVRAAMQDVIALGKQGVALSGEGYQGQFSIENRDGTTPHIKKVRVASTVEYYLAD